MGLDDNIVRYTFEVADRTLDFEIGTSPSDEVSPGEMARGNFPEWTRLGHEQCDCCPLKTERTTHCPAAIRMYRALEAFRDFKSVDEVRLSVATSRRKFVQECDLQSGLNSMLGLLMATSGCPVVGQLKAMATFHIPFCSFAETLHRSVSAYLIKQYFVAQDGGVPDWELEGLKQFYEQLEGLNEAFSQRIMSISRKDAVSNAMVIFFSTSIVAATAIEDCLEEYKDYFTGQAVTPP